ncbi:MAG: HAD-IIIA family hydrolase [Proteobacteria bacterium]|nr:HAD-IIIA family hydrolase [Pseudomonadota bacterium]
MQCWFTMPDQERHLAHQVAEKAAAIRAVIFDVDGVLTDGRIIYTDDGRELKAFSVQDGSAIKMLINNSIEVAIITGRRSTMVERRCAELGIRHLYQGIEHKKEAFEDLLTKLSLTSEQLAHVGDDLPDIPLFDLVGLAISVPNGHPAARARADVVTVRSGGEGVASEVCQMLLSAHGRWPY